MDETKSKQTMTTKLNKITSLSRQDPKQKFDWLMSHFTKENLISCFNELDGKKAVGIDGRTKEDYAQALENNIQSLVNRMKTLTYRPAPVRQVLIPKSNGQFRPLGISAIEDKIIQLMFSKILDAIYEPLFRNCSYGFRKNRNAHGAIKDAIDYLRYNNVKVVIDIDLENYFGNIRHKDLLKMLSLKIKDKIFIRYITRMLKAEIQMDNELKKNKVGLHQGSILSPILANVYAHYAIDLWFEEVVPKHTIGKVGFFRFCDDMIVCCTDTRDIDKLTRSLDKRLAKFGLKLNLLKTKCVVFNRYTFERGVKQGSFDFLGFTFYLSRARKDNFVTVKVKPAGRRCVIN